MHFGKGSGCPPVLDTGLAPAQAAVVAKHVLGAERFFQWGGGGGAEVFGALAWRSYTAEHYAPWCACIRGRPLARCLDQAERVATVLCTRAAHPLKSFGRLQRLNTKDPRAPRLIKETHEAYVAAIDDARRRRPRKETFEAGVFQRVARGPAATPRRFGGRTARRRARRPFQAGEEFFDAVLVDGRAHVSCAIKAVGYSHNASVVFVNGWPKKYAPMLLRYYNLRRTVGPDGFACRDDEARCLAALAPKPRYRGDKQTHAMFINRFKNFMRSPINF